MTGTWRMCMFVGGGLPVRSEDIVSRAHGPSGLFKWISECEERYSSASILHLPSIPSSSLTGHIWPSSFPSSVKAGTASVYLPFLPSSAHLAKKDSLASSPAPDFSSIHTPRRVEHAGATSTSPTRTRPPNLTLSASQLRHITSTGRLPISAYQHTSEIHASRRSSTARNSSR
jgi:hypothetical protein